MSELVADAGNAPVDKGGFAKDRMLGVLAAFAVTWGLVCLAMFTLSLLAEPSDLAREYNQEQVAYILATPAWVMFAKAMMTIGVLCGAVYLLLRKQSAYYWFMISIFGTLLTMLDSVMRGGFDILGGMMTGVNIGMIIVSIFLFWASYSALQDGQLSAD